MARQAIITEEVAKNKKGHPTIGKNVSTGSGRRTVDKPQYAITGKGTPSTKTALPTDTDRWQKHPEVVSEMSERNTARTGGYQVNDPHAAEKATHDWIVANADELNKMPSAMAEKMVRERYTYEQKEHAGRVAQFQKATDERIKAIEADQKAKAAEGLTPAKIQDMIKSSIDDARQLAGEAMKQHVYIGQRTGKQDDEGVGVSSQETGTLMVQDIHDTRDQYGNVIKSINASGYNPYYRMYGGTDPNRILADGTVNPNWRNIRPATSTERAYFQNKALSDAFNEVMNLKLSSYGMRWNPDAKRPEPLNMPQNQGIPTGTPGTPGALNTLAGDPNATMSQIQIMEDMIKRGINPKIVKDPVDGKTYVFTGRGNQKGWEELQITPPGEAPPDPRVAADNINAMKARADAISMGVPTSDTAIPTSEVAPPTALPIGIPSAPAPPQWRRGEITPDVAKSEGFINYLAPEGGTYSPMTENTMEGMEPNAPYAIPDDLANAMRSGIARGWDALGKFFVPQQTATY